ncbi:MAG: M48 family metallopeptidase [Bacteroidales bacterium]|nr:M48 family metallopeptidase [Bacteroidales bacterium]
MAERIFIAILIIVTAGFLLDRMLDWLNTKRWSDVLPEELLGIYDQEKYRKSQEYERVNHRFGLVTDTAGFLAIMLMLLLDGFAWVDQMARGFSQHPVVAGLLFFGILGLSADILSTPFSVYRTFIIEERFGFNRTTPLTFLTDKLKGWLLATLIGGGILALLIWIYLLTGAWFWLLAWGMITLFSVLMTMFYSNVIVPLFNRQTPLEPGTLRDAIEAYAKKAGFRLKNIYVMDSSKRSSKANAYFTGLGPKKRIVLFDTLIRDHHVDELVSILAHETGHYKKRHTATGLILSILQTGLMLLILSWMLGTPDLSRALGAETPSFHMGLVAFGILYTPLSLIIGLGMNALSRHHEYSADRYAGLTAGVESLQRALKKLSVNHLSNLRPHPAYVLFHYSHPPLLKRLSALDRIKERTG